LGAHDHDSSIILGFIFHLGKQIIHLLFLVDIPAFDAFSIVDLARRWTFRCHLPYICLFAPKSISIVGHLNSGIYFGFVKFGGFTLGSGTFEKALSLKS
jgi:hypothetical protein